MAERRVIALQARPLTADTWAPFGWLPANDVDPADATYRYEFQLDDPHVNFIAHASDEVEHTERGSLCAVMYRHDTHNQTLMPLNCDSVIAVAPAEVDFSRPEHFDAVRVFRLHPLEALALHRGTWHWGPFPLGDEPVRMFNVQGRRYAEDNASVQLERDHGTVVEVLP